VRIRYVKRPEELTTGASFESPLLSHWSEHMVLTMAIAALGMEESDTSRLEARKADIERKIERTAKDRDASFAIRVADIRGRDELDDEDWPLWP